MTRPQGRSFPTRSVCALLPALLLAAAPSDLEAQSRSSLKSQLKKKERQAKKDPDALLEVAQWARDYGLEAESKKILEKILKYDEDHAKTRELLGYVRVGEKWLTREENAERILKEREKEWKEQGFKKIGGVWVPEDKVEDAEAGRFWHEDARVSKADKIALQSGKVYHPRTGVLIDQADLSRAEEGMFPTPNGWVSLEKADKFHSNVARPWRVRSYNGWIIGSIPLEKLEAMKGDYDTALEQAASAMGSSKKQMPEPDHLPVVWVMKDTEQYKALTGELGDGGSVYGACLPREGVEVEIEGLPSTRPALVNQDENWGKYWVKHAAGLAYAQSIALDHGAEFPRWFLRAVAGHNERHFNSGVAKFFGEQHLAKGGVKDIAAWFSGFQISPDVSQKTVDFNIYQAGLVLGYANTDSCAEGLKAVEQLGAAIDAGPSKGSGKTLTGAIESIRAAVTADEDGLKAYFTKLLKG